MKVIYIPTVNDDVPDFVELFKIWNNVKDIRTRVEFDFSNCNFLRQNAVAFLGGLTRYLQQRQVQVAFRLNTLRKHIHTNLRQNGFISSFYYDEGPWSGNSIPYKELVDDQNIHKYLEEKWLGRGWVNISNELGNAIVGKVYEIYTNAFEHSNSSVGVFTCGQRFQNLNELKLTVVDFGHGIPKNVGDFLQCDSISAVDALQWAFKDGNSTRLADHYRGGIGLGILKDFIELNHGKMEVYSHNGYCLIDKQGQNCNSINDFFDGTIVNITLRCDELYYCMENEGTFENNNFFVF
ncbi:ATP-binding protein [Bacillus cereus group sp. BfR-BA-01489]|uniref:ATP-binding protein n=1 Tax=Bacillus cereus group sp. BfR-BA-01489 TaxID=2920358 RepID=UPI001F57D901